MIKRIALLTILSFLSLSAPALAAEAGTGIIEGQLVNETEGGSSVADQEVTMTTYLNDSETGSATAKTDAKGYFIFDSLSTAPGYSYQVKLVYQEADYYSNTLSFDADETNKFAEIAVYDSTTSDEGIKVMTSHTVMHFEQGGLWITEYFLFVNDTDRAYIGSKEMPAEGKRETLSFSLPEQATELQPSLGLMTCCIYNSEEGFVDTMPVLPGGREIAFAYRVDYNAGSYTFSRKVNFPTVNYDLLVEGEGSRVISDRLAIEEPLDIEGTLFKHLSGTDLGRGDIIVAQLSGLPNVDNQGSLKWAALALVMLIFGFGSAYLLRKRRPQPVNAKVNLDQRKQGLLAELAQLDDDFEGGKIHEDVYHRLRAEKKWHLTALMQRSREKSGR